MKPIESDTNRFVKIGVEETEGRIWHGERLDGRGN